MIWHGLTRIREAFEGSSKALGHLTLDLDPDDLVLNVFHEGDMRASPWDARCAVEIPGSGTEWVWENNSHSQFVIIVCTCSHLFSMITFWRWSDYEFSESHFSKSITLHQSVVWYEHELTQALRCSEHFIICRRLWSTKRAMRKTIQNKVKGGNPKTKRRISWKCRFLNYADRQGYALPA